MTRHIAVYAVALLGVIATQSTSAYALSMSECSAKYKRPKPPEPSTERNGMTSAERNASRRRLRHRPPRLHPPLHLRLRRRCRRVRSETLFSRVPLIPDIRIGPLVKREWKPVSINTEPTRRIMPTAD